MLSGGGGGGGLVEFDAEFKFAKIQNSHVEGGGGEGLAEFDAEFKFAKIQNSHVQGGGGGLAEFDAEFKFAKIQNSHVDGGRGGGSWNLMLSPNLLKKKKKFGQKLERFCFGLWVQSGSPVRSIGEPQ